MHSEVNMDLSNFFDTVSLNPLESGHAFRGGEQQLQPARRAIVLIPSNRVMHSETFITEPRAWGGFGLNPLESGHAFRVRMEGALVGSGLALVRSRILRFFALGKCWVMFF
jgi:hypothetical protein